MASSRKPTVMILTQSMFTRNHHCQSQKHLFEIDADFCAENSLKIVFIELIMRLGDPKSDDYIIIK